MLFTDEVKTENKNLRMKLKKVAYLDSAIERLDALSERLGDISSQLCAAKVAESEAGPSQTAAEEGVISTSLRKRITAMHGHGASGTKVVIYVYFSEEPVLLL